MRDYFNLPLPALLGGLLLCAGCASDIRSSIPEPGPLMMMEIISGEVYSCPPNTIDWIMRVDQASGGIILEDHDHAE